jgi:hypothetical protein
MMVNYNRLLPFASCLLPIAFCLSLLTSLSSLSQELPLYLTYSSDCPASMVIPEGRWEAGLFYGKVDDTIDVLNIKKQELSTISSQLRADSLGNYEHLKLNLNYGLTYQSMISTGITSRSIDYGSGKLKVYSYRFSIRKSFKSLFSIDIGLKGNIGKDRTFSNVDDINYYLHKFRPDIYIKIDPSYVWFVKEAADLTIEYGVPRREDPYFELKDLKDSTKFIRITLGKAFEFFYPNIFLEYGKTNINTKIDTNLKDIIPSSSIISGYKNRLPELPIDLSRDESYWKGGFSIFLRTPFKTLTSVEYNYIKLNRDADLGYINYNHILKAKVDYFLRRNIILSIGGEYLHRQFNGVIPFMYNKYSQTTFDHRYGWVEVGVIFLWK